MNDSFSFEAWVIGAAIAVVLGVAVAYGLARIRRRKQLSPSSPPQRDSLPTPAPAKSAAVELRSASAELRGRAQAAQEALTAEQSDAGRAAKREEIAKLRKQAYVAERSAEREAKSQRRQEREASLALERQAAKREQERREAAERAAAEIHAARVASEAGLTLSVGLRKTRGEGFMASLHTLLGRNEPIDTSVLGELEAVLFGADIGVATATRLVATARSRTGSGTSGEALKEIIREEITRMIQIPTADREDFRKPQVVMVVGVNGSGKTTTIGKLAARAHARGERVLLGAGDTYRAAAAEQLDVWGERAGVEVVKGAPNADSASVLFEAVKRGVAEGYDVVYADTAGRLHTKANLMEELKKVRRVIGKAMPGAPHEVLLVLDATNGQNSLIQAREFLDAIGVTGIALTKLDGTAKGGVIIGICDELKVPVRWVGVGERAEDLRAFSPSEYVDALFQA